MIDTLILDRGHATLSNTNTYATPGKQYVFPDGLHVYEGYENQKYVEAIARHASLEGFKIVYTVRPNDIRDISLAERVRIANTFPDRKNALYISVHNNAGGGEGTEVFSSKGKTLSDGFAEEILLSIEKEFPTRKMRYDKSDGDRDKEENFYVIKNTIMPAVLLELGFFDNRKDYEFLSNPLNIERMAKAIVTGVKNNIIKLYGVQAWQLRNL